MNRDELLRVTTELAAGINAGNDDFIISQGVIGIALKQAKILIAAVDKEVECSHKWAGSFCKLCDAVKVEENHNEEQI